MSAEKLIIPNNHLERKAPRDLSFAIIDQRLQLDKRAHESSNHEASDAIPTDWHPMTQQLLDKHLKDNQEYLTANLAFVKRDPPKHIPVLIGKSMELLSREFLENSSNFQSKPEMRALALDAGLVVLIPSGILSGVSEEKEAKGKTTYVQSMLNQDVTGFSLIEEIVKAIKRRDWDNSLLYNRDESLKKVLSDVTPPINIEAASDFAQKFYEEMHTDLSKKLVQLQKA